MSYLSMQAFGQAHTNHKKVAADGESREERKGIELNTGGLKNGMRDFHPCMGALKRYRELGGEVITIGSDSHNADNIAAHFQRAAHVLKECGFRYYCVFEKRSPEFHKL